MLNWLESRTGFVTMTKDFLTEDVPGGAILLVRLRKRNALRDDLADRHRHLPHDLLFAVVGDRMGIDASTSSKGPVRPARLSASTIGARPR